MTFLVSTTQDIESEIAVRGGYEVGVAVTEVAFIDPAVADVEVLLAGLRSDVLGFVLDAAEPAAAQMARALVGYRGLRAVHVIVHGAPGELQFASGSLSSVNLDQHAAAIAGIGEALGTAGSLSLWSCDVAQGGAGAAFIAALHSLLGAPVAASTRIIGAAARSGTWQLDAFCAARTPLTLIGMQTYQGAMGTITAATINSISPDTGASSTDFITDAAVTSVTVTVSGVRGNNNKVSIYYATGSNNTTLGTLLGTVPVSGDGTMTVTGLTAIPAGGAYTLQVVDASSKSVLNTQNLNYDTTAPVAPSTPVLIVASDTGSSSTDGITSVTTPTFTGTAESGSTVALFDGTTQIGSAVATGGNWSITSSTLGSGTHSITAKATDAAGNVGVASTAKSVTIDTSAPVAPSTPSLSAASDTGSSSTDGITSVTTPTFTGTAEAGSTVTLFDGTTQIGSAVATGGNWSITSFGAGNGAHSITAKATDAAGNVGVASTANRLRSIRPRRLRRPHQA